MSEIEYRDSAKVVGVSFPKRTIELVVMPYNEPTEIEHRGRIVKESVAPGAFDGIERRPNRVRVNYQHQDHELRHLLGRASAFYPARPEGLVATVNIRKGEHGNDALEAADAGDLGASAGFGVMPGGETWPDHETRRLTRLFLDHIALTPTPAYRGAEVIAVRKAQQDPVGRPNLEIVRARELERLYSSIRQH
jgi:HK97 family phage prohead protease